MQIHGLNKTTLLDYPEHVAAAVFCGGCNFRCPFCHNSQLVLHPNEQPVISQEEVFAFLEKRKGILEGVCITGGEPSIQPDLAEFIYTVKNMGYQVKLDTNGYKPEVLENLVEGNLLDYIAMDIKSGKSGYAGAAGVQGILVEKIKKSIDFIMRSGVKYEFRTTLVKGIHKPEDIDEIGSLIQGCDAFFLQAYREDEQVMQPGFDSFTREEMEAFVRRIKPFVKNVNIRGLD